MKQPIYVQILVEFVYSVCQKYVLLVENDLINLDVGIDSTVF